MKVDVPVVLIPSIPPLPAAPVTVTTPADAADTDRFEPKSIVPMVPTKVPLSLMMIPVPDAVTPVSPEPSPTNDVAVTTPEELTFEAVSCATVTFGVPVNPSATVAIPAVFA